MLRSVYRLALRLHPRHFRRRFADEMLAIFDENRSTVSGLKSLLDAAFSLLRQWILRPQSWSPRQTSALPGPIPDGVPSFYTVSGFRPSGTAVVNGILLTTFVFCATCFAIKYSWIRVLHVQIASAQFDSTEPAAGSWTNANGPGSSPPNLESSSTAPAPLTPHASGLAETSETSARQTEPSTGEKSPQSMKSNVERVDSGADHVHDSATLAKGQYAIPPVPSARERQRVLAAVIMNLQEHYIDRGAASNVVAALKASAQRHEYDSLDEAALAGILTRQVREVSRDPHLEIVYSETILPQPRELPASKEAARYRRQLEGENCGFERSGFLSNNIGYLKMNAFPDLSICEPKAAAAMASINNADAIIFDLRDNRGGMPETVSFIASYLFDHPEYWYNPRENTTAKSWTRSPVPGSKLAGKPVYLLLSSKTFSGAEQFSYDLKMLHRATLIGETTGGTAHSAVFHRIDDHFAIAIPEAKAINPFATPDWQGTGVEPDVKVKAADALSTAEKLAALKVRSRALQ
jgi:hypothetical protein